MAELTAHRWPPIVRVISILMIGEALTFLLASLLHLGIPILPGFSQPRIIPAMIIEGLCWLFLAISLYAMFTHKTWTWRITVAAHVFASLGVLLGIYATNGGIRDEANFIYHRVILGVLVVTLALLATPGARTTLGHRRA